MCDQEMLASTYMSSSNEEGMGSAPSTVEGMGACRDMMGDSVSVVDSVARC